MFAACQGGGGYVPGCDRLRQKSGDEVDLIEPSKLCQTEDVTIGMPNLAGVEGLIQAASNGKVDRLREILDSRIDVNATNKDAETALHKAAYHGRKFIVEALVQAGASANLVDKKGKTALRRAYDSEEITRMLLEARADPNAAEKKDGGTTLHRAVEGGYVDVVQLLLDAGADPSKGNNEGETPLHDAATFGQTTVAEVLIGAGAKLNATDKYGNTPLHCCTYGNSIEAGLAVSRILLDAGADPKMKNKDGETFLVLAEPFKEQL